MASRLSARAPTAAAAAAATATGPPAAAGPSDEGGKAGHALAMRQGFQAVLEAIHASNLPAFKSAVKQLGSTQKELKHLKDSFGRTMLHHAAQQGSTAICTELVEALGLDVNDQDSQGESPLALASATAHPDTVRYLLAKGAVPNLRQEPDGTAPLHRAANGKSLEVIDLLVGAGADVNMASKTGTPLCWAAGAGQADNVEHLLKHGAVPSPEASSRGEALLMAAACGCDRAVDLLLAAGADADRAGQGGATALHAVAAVDLNEGAAARIVAALLAAGANPDVRDEGGFTPVVVAAARRRLRVLDLLLPVSAAAAAGLDGVEWTADAVIAAAEQKLERLQAEIKSQQPEPAKVLAAEVTVPEAAEPDEGLAADSKRKGDEAFVRQDFSSAEVHYSQSLRHATGNAVVWASRSLVQLRLGEPGKAVEDARISRTLDPAYVKAWFREGAAFAALRRWEDAALAYFEASSLDPKNQEVAKAFQTAIAEGRKESAALKQGKGGK